MAQKNKISEKNLQIIEDAKQYGLYLYDLTNIYGATFVTRFYKSIQNGKKRPGNTMSIDYPKNKTTNKDLAIAKQRLFRKHIKLAGFTIEQWSEDFIDEDTGEIVSIWRYEVEPLVKKEPAIYAAYHDDDCEERLERSGKCPNCNFNPDMQSTALYHHCPYCDVKLSMLQCPQCEKRFAPPK